jgi:hypothetical protein
MTLTFRSIRPGGRWWPGEPRVVCVVFHSIRGVLKLRELAPLPAPDPVVGTETRAQITRLLRPERWLIGGVAFWSRVPLSIERG